MRVAHSKAIAAENDDLKRSEPRFRSFNDAIPAIACLSVSTGSPEFWNKRWHDYTGLSADSSQGCGWHSAIHPEDREELAQKWRLGLETEARVLRLDGVYPWFLFRAEQYHGSWYGIAVDIEERKRADQILRENEQQFRTITNLIPQYIVVLAPDGNVLYVNQVALERTGIDMAEVQEEDSFWRPFHPDDVERVRAERRAGWPRAGV